MIVRISGEQLYAFYNQSSGGVNYQGQPVPTWPHLPVHIQRHWNYTAEQVNKATGAR